MVTTLLSQFGQMLDKALLGLIVLSRDGRILEANHTLSHMFGYDEHELIGKAVEVLVPEDSREIYPVHREHFIQSGFSLPKHEQNLKGRKKDGSIFSVEVRLSAIPYGQEVAPAAIVIDTTARKQIEQQRDTLLAQEQQARAQAENMQRRQAFLTQASNIITSSLDYETTLTTLAQTALPFLGDSCMIDLLQHGRMQRVAAVHINPAKHALVQHIWRNFEPVLTASHPLTTLLTEGKPILLPQIQEEHIRRAAFDEHHFQVMQDLRICSMMIVPLIVRETIIGAISLFISESDRHYTKQDIHTAQEFAALAAQALENARLFRELEDAIQQKNETVALLETIVSSAPFGFAFLDSDQRYRMINSSLAMLSEQPIESYIGKTPAEAIPEFSPFIMPNLRYVQESNQPLLNLEFTAPAPPSSPEPKHWMMHYYPVSTHQGAFLGVGILLVDITQAKRAAQAIARYKILADHGSDIFLFLTYDGTIIEANRAACQAYGYEYTTLCGMNFAAIQDRDHKIDITRSQQGQGGNQCESIHLRRDGQPFPVDIVLFHSMIEGTPVVACTIRDISERKRAERERQAREAQFYMLAENAHDIIYRYQYQEPIGFSYVSPSSTKILGYTPEEHYADPKLGEKLIHPDDLPIIRSHNPAETPNMPVVFRWVCKDGSIRWAEQHITPIFDPEGTLVAIEGIARDITERKVDEEARGRLAAIVNSSEDAIIGVNLQNIIVSWNRGAERLTGYTEEEVIGQSPLFLIPPEKRAERQQLYNQIKDAQAVMHNETIWCCKDGRKIYVNITISPIRYNDITIGFSAIGRDITEHKQAEHALRRQASLNKLLQIIVAAANKASTLESVLETAVDQICLSMGWPMGHVYMATETGFFALVSSNIWHVSDPQQFAAFRSITEMTKVALLDDLPGKVLLSGKAEWTNELTSVDSPLRTKLICESGICAGFAFPVLVGAETVAVLEFFANEPVEPDAQLLEVVQHVGAHLGRVVERARAESAIRASEERYRLIADNTADLITMIDQQGLIIYASPSYAWMLGLNPANLVGESIYHHIHPHEQERAKRTWSYSTTELESQITIRMRAKEGEWRSIAIRGMHTAQRDQHYLVCVGHDVTEQQRSEEALRSAETRYRTLVEQIPAIIYTTPLERQAHTSYISPQLFSILGFSPEEWLNDPRLWDRQIHPEDRGLVQEISAQTRQKRQTYTSEYRIFSRDGRLVWVQDTARVVYDEQGSPLFVQGIALDITDRKQAEEALRRSEQLYRALTHNFPNGSVILFDQDLNITIADGTDLARFNLSSEILEGQSLKGSISTFLYDTIESLCYATLAGEMISREFELRGYFYRAHILPVRNEHGEIMAGMIMSQDISDYKEATRALAEERTLLARRVEERTADLSAANAELARAARLKDEFLANMSHELRTPLNAVLGLSEALREQAYGPVNERQDRSLQTIEESGRHLLELINDILDLAKVGAGKMELFLEPTSIDMICQTSLRLIRQSALKKGITIQTSIDPQAKQIVADPRRLKQILVNLTSNAVKFTPEGGRIGLEVVADEMQQAIHFTVWDTGIGIAADQLEQLFQPFVQLDSSLSRHYEGTGLGLALVYRMTELHGGSVSASSIQGEGSTFRVSLPWKKADPPPGPTQIPTPEAPSAIRFKRALIIEDSQTSAEHIARYLGEYHIETKIVPVGGVALMTAKELQPDLIFLDLLLPDISGWDVLAQLKADEQTKNTPVVIISVVDDQRQGSEMGAIAHMTKPCTRAALRQVLHHITPGVPGPFISNVCEQPPTILLAEDNESNILTIADYLENTGYHVVVARNGAEAIAQAREVRPKLILMDIQMPGMDGIEATKRIRADPQIGSIPILAMTALAMPGDRERCLDAGATDYMSKPISLHQLTDTIDSLI